MNSLRSSASVLALVILAVSSLVSMAPCQVDETQLLCVTADGVVSHDHSWDPALAEDGRYAVFASYSPVLVPGDVNGSLDVYRKDVVTGEIVCASRLADGTNQDGDSRYPVVSADGSRIAFFTHGKKLVPDDAPSPDIVLWDEALGHSLVSVAADGTAAGGVAFKPSISADGRFVLFLSDATDIVAGAPASSAYLRDTLLGLTEVASVGLGGEPANRGSSWVALSSDARFVAFYTDANNVVPEVPSYVLDSDVFVRDRETGNVVQATTSLAGQEFAWGLTSSFALSGDGRRAAFVSQQHGMIPGHPFALQHLYVKDTVTGVLECVAWSSSGVHLPYDCGDVSLSHDGRFVGFSSPIPSIVPEDTNAVKDVFLHDRVTGTVVCASLALSGMAGTGPSRTSSLSGDGRRIAFTSFADDLVAGDVNLGEDVFLRNVGPFRFEGPALAGIAGKPALFGSGTLEGGSHDVLRLEDAAPSAAALLLVALSPVPVPFKGGTLQAYPPAQATWLGTDASGRLELGFDWPTGFPAGVTAMLQVCVADAAAVKGVSISNGLFLLTP